MRYILIEWHQTILTSGQKITYQYASHQLFVDQPQNKIPTLFDTYTLRLLLSAATIVVNFSELTKTAKI